MKLTKHEVSNALKIWDSGYPKRGYMHSKDILRSVAELFVSGTLIYKDEIQKKEAD